MAWQGKPAKSLLQCCCSSRQAHELPSEIWMPRTVPMAVSHCSVCSGWDAQQETLIFCLLRITNDGWGMWAMACPGKALGKHRERFVHGCPRQPIFSSSLQPKLLLLFPVVPGRARKPSKYEGRPCFQESATLWLKHTVYSWLRFKCSKHLLGSGQCWLLWCALKIQLEGEFWWTRLKIPPANFLLSPETPTMP